MATTTLAERPGVLRRSALEAFACPYRFQQIYELGTEDVSEESLRGQAFHEAAGTYIRTLWEKRVESDPDEARLALATALVAYKLPPETAKEVEWIFTRWAERFRLDLDAYLLAEERQAKGDVSWIPDLVYARDSELEIKDWKTYHSALTDAQAEESFQARLYVWMAMKLWPNFPRYRFTFVFVRFGWEVSVSWAPGELDDMEVRIASILAGISEARRKNEWPARPGNHCGLCRLRCPLIDQPGLDTVRVTTREEAERAMGEFLALDRAVQRRREALKAWCETEGDLVMGGARAGYQTWITRKAPAEAVLKVLQEHKIADSRLTFSASALKSYLTAKKHALVKTDLEPLLEEKPLRRFVVRTDRDPVVKGDEQES